jgi:hypothetical protein
MAGYRTKFLDTVRAQVAQEVADKSEENADREGWRLALEQLKQEVITVIFPSPYAMCTRLMG